MLLADQLARRAKSLVHRLRRIGAYLSPRLARAVLIGWTTLCVATGAVEPEEPVEYQHRHAASPFASIIVTGYAPPR